MLPVDIVLNAETLCNLSSERQALQKAINNGEHVVIFGRRNTGKTSLVKGVCVPEFLASYKSAIVIEVDFIGVDSLLEIQTRLRIALEKGLSRTFPTKQSALKIVTALAKLRPKLELDAMSGNVELKLGIENHFEPANQLENYFEEIARLANKHYLLLVMDEFQDLDFVKGAIARIRTCLQSISVKMPIIILGSKKHLLARIFGAHRSPLAGWGRDLQISPVISQQYKEEYLRYANKSFAKVRQKLEREEFFRLCDLVQGIPEAINIVLNTILSRNRSLTSKDIRAETAIRLTIDEKSSRFEETLSRFSPNERQLLTAIAKFQPVPHLKGKVFLAALRGVAPTSVTHAAKKLEDKAEIYREKLGYVIGEPLLCEYLKATR